MRPGFAGRKTGKAGLRVAKTSKARSADAPRIVVVTTMKDEGPYILDWVAHYKSIGATDIVVFTNDCTDPTDHILRSLNRMGVIEHRFSRVMRRGPHKSALMWAEYEPTVRQAEWLLVVDVDEFLQIKTGDGTLPGLVDAHPDVDAISVVWRIFGNAGVEHIGDAPVPVEFTMAQAAQGGPEDVRFFKTLFRNNGKFSRMGVHRPFLTDDVDGVNWILADGTLIAQERQSGALHVGGHYAYDSAQLNHYALRSIDGFINKQQRGRANHFTSNIGQSYWNRFDLNEEEDTGLAERFGDADALKAGWLEDHNLNFFHRKALKHHRKNARQMRKTDVGKEVLRAI